MNYREIFAQVNLILNSR